MLLFWVGITMKWSRPLLWRRVLTHRRQAHLGAAVGACDQVPCVSLVSHADKVGGHGLDINAVLFEQHVQDLLQEDKAGIQNLDETDVDHELPIPGVVQDAVTPAAASVDSSSSRRSVHAGACAQARHVYKEGKRQLQCRITLWSSQRQPVRREVPNPCEEGQPYTTTVNKCGMLAGHSLRPAKWRGRTAHSDCFQTQTGTEARQ